MYCQTSFTCSNGRWNYALFLRATEYIIYDRLLANRVLGDGNISGYYFLLPSEFKFCWISCGEGFHVLWLQFGMTVRLRGTIASVINLKKQPKNSRFYSLVLFTKPDKKPWKRKHSSHCFVSQQVRIMRFITYHYFDNLIFMIITLNFLVNYYKYCDCIVQGSATRIILYLVMINYNYNTIFKWYTDTAVEKCQCK